jgi:hypothetical protein
MSKSLEGSNNHRMISSRSTGEHWFEKNLLRLVLFMAYNGCMNITGEMINTPSLMKNKYQSNQGSPKISTRKKGLEKG